MDDGAIHVDGEVYVSVDTLLDTMQAMLALRDELIHDRPEMVVLVPGSDMALASLAKTLLQLKERVLSGVDTKEEAAGLIEDIYKFLGDQDGS